MTTSKEPQKVLEGVFAIHKPPAISSAEVIRRLQAHFNPSALFRPWFVAERAKMRAANAKPRQFNHLQVKIGHGGTLDPLATGVLVIGIGRGTKLLSRFLECTKSYECVVLFGAATDTYDVTGKVVSKGDYGHITREKVEEALKGFRGKIMQKPSVFSALKVNGKKMYELARAGAELPEIKPREVEVLNLEMVEWMEGGIHEYEWPAEEVDDVAQAGAQKLMGANAEDLKLGFKRLRDDDDGDEDVQEVQPDSKKSKIEQMDPEPVMSGALPVESTSRPSEAPLETAANPISSTESKPILEPAPAEPTESGSQDHSPKPKPNPPAARLTMTVTSGFYVRSLCHDLGLALSSYGTMSTLVRSRQGDYTLGQNVFESGELVKGEEVWAPQIRGMLEESMGKEGWEATEVVVGENDAGGWTPSSGDHPEGRGIQKHFNGRGKNNWRGKGERRGNYGRGRGEGNKRRNSSSPE
ncbi:pseudouridine synthase [Lophium mytilinum]|uniref:tRNA pseudouridine(55) synthase n=1 Tax=Lophium mytilinum TaxID=390894 RepID=A0A6A6QCK5_9PEZI|nr:pseudouridine synthase [Lophium mytilinum]